MLIEQYKIEAGGQLDSHYPTIYFCIMRLRFFSKSFFGYYYLLFFPPNWVLRGLLRSSILSINLSFYDFGPKNLSETPCII